MLKVGKGRFLAALLVAPLWGGVQARTVDCKSDAPIDKLVCSTPHLLNLDQEMTSAYEAAKKQGRDPAAVMQRAREDLAWRNANCLDVKCLERWYRQSIDTYLAYAKGPETLTNEWIAQRNTKESLSRSGGYKVGAPRGAAGNPAAAAMAASLRGDPVARQPDPSPPKVLAVTMSDLYSQNSIAADERYLGKELLIEAQVLEVSRDHSGDPFVVASGGYDGKLVVLMFSKDQQSRLAPLRRWATATFNCKGMGDQGAYVLVDCRQQSAAPRKAKPLEQVQGMLSEADRLNGECRGGMPSNPRTSEACRDRDLLVTQIRHAGWCWGHAADAGYQRRWVECAPGD